MPETTNPQAAVELAKHVTRAIHALKSPAPAGSEHYRSGWDDGLEAAIDAVRDEVLRRMADEPASGPSRVAGEAQQPETRADCPHCPDGHTPPTGGSQPWSAWVASDRDGDGQPMQITVARSAGAHVAESDAQWVRDVLNGRADVPTQELPLDHPLRRECRCSEAGVCRRCSERASVATPPAVVSQPGKEA